MPKRPHPLDPRHLRRRLALAAQRGWRTTSGGLAEPCLFLHLPKCGGTSLAAALAGTVSARHRVGAIDALATRRAAAMLTAGRDDLLTCHEDLDLGHNTFALREQVLAAHMAHGCRLIHGHVFFPAHLLSAAPLRYRLVTMMRDPPRPGPVELPHGGARGRDPGRHRPLARRAGGTAHGAAGPALPVCGS